MEKWKEFVTYICICMMYRQMAKHLMKRQFNQLNFQCSVCMTDARCMCFHSSNCSEPQCAQVQSNIPFYSTLIHVRLIPSSPCFSVLKATKTGALQGGEYTTALRNNSITKNIAQIATLWTNYMASKNMHLHITLLSMLHIFGRHIFSTYL